jgi:hypothetical protein
MLSTRAKNTSLVADRALIHELGAVHLALTIAMSILATVASVRARALISLAFIVVTSLGSAGEKAPPFEGMVSAALSRGGTSRSHVESTRKGDLLRIENTTNKLEPINIVDLAASKLTIVYPHNTTFVVVDLKKSAAGASGPPGAAISDRGSNAASPPPIPPIPPMPPMPVPGMPAPAALKATDKTRMIQGFDCTLYTVRERGETFEIWATKDAGLFPFRLLERDSLGRPFGPPMLEETWPEKLREKSLFPLEAILKRESGGTERFSFKVDKISKSEKSDNPSRTAGGQIDNDKLFEPPAGYHEIQAPQF